jgi:hypothetical protein
LFAIFVTYSKDISNDEKCPISITLTMLAGYIICFTFGYAYLTGQTIDILSTATPNGLFSFFGNG